MPTTRSTLAAMARQYADMEHSAFVSDAELSRYLQDSYGELYDLLVSKHQDYFVEGPVEFSVADGANTYALPADFYKLLGVDLSLGGGRWREMDPFNFNERNVEGERTYNGIAPRVRYRVLGDALHIVPADKAPGAYRLWYVANCPVLAGDSDELDATSDKWREYVIVDAAIKMLSKEESDVSVLMAKKAMLTKRIEDSAASRDAGRSARVQDVRRGGYDPWEF